MPFSTLITRWAGLAAGAVLLAACSGTPDPQPDAPGYTLEVVKGDAQTDTIGHVVSDTVVVRARRGTRLLRGYLVRYEASACGEWPTNEPYETDWSGRSRYRWRLSGEVGAQQLRIRLFDSAGVERATATLGATAVQPTRGWHPAACLPGPVGALAQQPGGRLVAGVRDRLYTSPDNGVSWQPLAFPKVLSLTVNEIVSVGASELLVRASVLFGNPGNGLYYSSDNGASWQLRNAGLRDDFFTDVLYTRGGRILLSSQYNGLMASSNKGQSWSPVPLPVPAARAPFSSLSEAPNGDLYLLDYDGKIFRATGGGTTWQRLPDPPATRNTYAYPDPDNGDLYVATNFGLFRSADQGTTWQLVYQTPPASSFAVTRVVKAGGAFYLDVNGQGLVRTTDFAAFRYLTRPATGEPWGGGWFGDALLTANGTVLLNGRRSALDNQTGLYYNQRP
ncbi:WD40/YVTN/BNR-like repeat-containing protein [Hymenobacter psychrotolerans]|uniref:DUF6242 domain-containing protein n=1 Tax=Hymenobacter psychrotolerans DSM 18569 TaxID=1121959 RepID=A0A1M6VJV4_9BACT|nr:sialidase family protein [Hymenobacter psychrotolerans]SHK81770.1 hypothetical protein SAMN02746009_01633 [Hymenobacter psychrotolerans DSM 18569]